MTVPLTGTGTDAERERLAAFLEAYAADDVRAMLERHSPDGASARRKGERIARLVDLFTDPNFARRAVAGLRPLSRRLLGVVQRYGQTSLAALFLAGYEQPGDDEAVQRELIDLLRRGLLFVQERESGRKVTLDLSEPASRLRWVTAAQAILDALPARREKGEKALLGREPGRVETGSFALLRRDLYLALRFLRNTGMRLTRTGGPHRTDLRKLLAALQPGTVAPGRGEMTNAQLDGRLLFLLQLLIQAGLLHVTEDALLVDEAADTFLTAPELTAARRLYEAWLQLEWNEFARIPHLLIEPWSYQGVAEAPGAERLVTARHAIVEALTPLVAETHGDDATWLRLDAVSEFLRRTDPEFLIPRVSETSASYYAYFNYYGAYYQQQQVQEQSYYRGLARAESRGRERRLRKDQNWQEVEGAFVAQVARESLLWLGLVDVGYDSDDARPIALRLTDLGARLLTAAPPPDEGTVDGALLVVQPSFEILVLDALQHLDLLARLDVFAEAQSLDRAAVYRLTRAAFVRGLAAGWSEEQIVNTLEAAAAGPLPQNVRRTVRDWSLDYERVHLHRGATLLEVDDAAELDAWLADPLIAPLVQRRLAPTVALLSTLEAHALEGLLARNEPSVQVTDYAVDEPQILDLPQPGEIVVPWWNQDPYLHYQLSRFADLVVAESRDGAGRAVTQPPRDPRHFRVTPESLARARQGGLAIDEILSYLGYKSRVGLSPDDVLSLRGWSGHYAAFRHAAVRAVELPPTANWGELVRVKAIRPLVLKVLSTSLALIGEEHWERFQAELTQRGISFEADLTAQTSAERRGAAQRPADRLGLATAQELLAAGTVAPGGAPALRSISGRALIDFIEEALDAEAPLVIEYRKPSERRSAVRTVEPRALEVRGGAYYLQAFCHSRREECSFRLTHIRGIARASQ